MLEIFFFIVIFFTQFFKQPFWITFAFYMLFMWNILCFIEINAPLALLLLFYNIFLNNISLKISHFFTRRKFHLTSEEEKKYKHPSIKKKLMWHFHQFSLIYYHMSEIICRRIIKSIKQFSQWLFYIEKQVLCMGCYK